MWVKPKFDTTETNNKVCLDISSSKKLWHIELSELTYFDWLLYDESLLKDIFGQTIVFVTVEPLQVSPEEYLRSTNDNQSNNKS